MEKVILTHALQNAVKYKGKANVNAVIGKVFSEKLKIKDIPKKVKEIVNYVNSLSLEEQEKQLRKLAPKIKKKIIKKKELPPLKNVKGNVVMRFEPSPSGPMHIGHAYTILLNSEYAKKYNGEFILRISDTNPENIYEPAYKMLVEDAEWVTGGKIDKVIIQSDRMETYYDYAEKLIALGKAYVCTCSTDEFRTLISNKKACPCRALPIKEQHQRFDRMFLDYQKGEAVLRIKTDLKHKNPAIRDWPALRINETEHPRTEKKYRVWPLLNFAVAVDDIELRITHVIRGKDHITNTVRQEYIYNYLKKKLPEFIHVGRLNYKDLKISASETRKLIEYGKFKGWDDIRLPFLLPFKRRGLQPGAFRRYVIENGPSPVDKTVDYEEFMQIIYAYDREIIDKDTLRFFFIENPKKIKIKNAPELTTKINLHPDCPKKGFRLFKTSTEFYINDKLKKGKIYRFMHLFNFKDNKFVSENYDPKLKAELIHWLPVSKLFNVDVLMPNGKFKKGLGEPGLKKVKVGQVIQLERFAFVRCDKKEKNRILFWFAHR